MYRKVFSMFSLVMVLAVVFSAVSPVAAQPSFETVGDSPVSVEESPNGIYIVQMANDPAIAYDGNVTGLRVTQPIPGETIDKSNPDVIKYVAYLEAQHAKALSKVGGTKVHEYGYTFNGFSAQMTLEQANKMAAFPGVLSVSADGLQTVDTSSTPTFLGLDAYNGLWDQFGSALYGGIWEIENGFGGAGEGMVIGIIDSGIWPESLSFTDCADNDNNWKPSECSNWDASGNWEHKHYTKPKKKWKLACNLGDAECNYKLIGAQYFNAAWGGDAGMAAQRPWEFLSARDYNGHGTHTASTAGGNYGVQATGPAAGFGKISGMAPRARISMYKALWSTEDGSTASGFTSDLVEAIDQAVADGVNVINYSISGTTNNFLDPVEIAFLFAADAGVFVSASAGNSGPAVSTVAHISPWITTVAAGTHNRNGEGSVTLGNGSTYFGASIASAVGPLPLIDSTVAGLPGADPVKVALCYAAVDNGGVPVLDPALIAGKIVLCDRGVTARVNKSLAVQEAGGLGMLLFNPTASSINADFHFVPTVHLQNTDRAAVKAYAATPDATATINQASIVLNAAAPFTASFSSRGPMLGVASDLLKPDVIAPGQDILASVSPVTAQGRDFNLYSGTSMSAPHVAGIAALLKQLHPKWTPMMIKSALMTSAYDILDGPNTNPLVIFRQGAGHIQPNSAAFPGLVYDAGFNDWLAFLCGTTTGVTPATCSALSGMGYSLDPSDLNVASIAIGDLAGQQTVKRTVKNVGEKEKYTFSYTGLAGITVTPSVTSFTINRNASKSYNVTFTNNGAALNAYVGGYITWTGNLGHVVRIPVVLRPVVMAAPASVSSNGSPINYNVKFGYNGAFTATGEGLVAAQTFPGSINNGEFLCEIVSIPAGTTYARFSLFNENTTPGSDLDLYVFNSVGAQVGGSGGGESNEEVNLVNPAAGDYEACVDGFGTANPSTYTMFAWALNSTPAGNMVVSAPGSAVIGGPSAINLTFSGLAPATKYLGRIVYGGTPGLPTTVVRVDTP